MAATISDLISKGGVYTDIEGNSPQQVYRELSQIIPLPHSMSPDVFYNALFVIYSLSETKLQFIVA